MNALAQFHEYFAACPLIAILRGLTPSEANTIGDALFESGIRIIEVPLNSPDPFDSIARLAVRFAGRALIGAGTVLNAADVNRVCAAGGRLVVSPNSDPQVIAAGLEAYRQAKQRQFAERAPQPRPNEHVQRHARAVLVNGIAPATKPQKEQDTA